ncbi:MAG: hypothetical protein JKY91_05390 [Emcibacter sp.]|nr:hypothetical protein [Emcibacter sp.]
MPTTSFKQFLEFIKFSFSMPFRLGWSFLWLLLIGVVALVVMYFFGYSMITVEKIITGDTVRIYGEPSLRDRAVEFSIGFTYELVWQIWAGYIFVVVFISDQCNKLIVRRANDTIKKNYKAICSLAVILSILFILLPTNSVSLSYRSEIYILHYYMIYLIGVLFVFSLIEIIQKDKSFFEAAAASILLLKGRYIFTFFVLSILFFGLNYIENIFHSLYVDYFNDVKVLTFSRKMAYVQGAMKAVIDIISVSIYSGAVIFLYDSYRAQDAETPN